MFQMGYTELAKDMIKVNITCMPSIYSFLGGRVTPVGAQGLFLAPLRDHNWQGLWNHMECQGSKLSHSHARPVP